MEWSPSFFFDDLLSAYHALCRTASPAIAKTTRYSIGFPVPEGKKRKCTDSSGSRKTRKTGLTNALDCTEQKKNKKIQNKFWEKTKLVRTLFFRYVNVSGTAQKHVKYGHESEKNQHIVLAKKAKAEYTVSAEKRY